VLKGCLESINLTLILITQECVENLFNDLTDKQWNVLEPLIPPALREQVRHRVGRQITPAPLWLIAKTTEVAQEVGYDRGKLVKGHKRHILVDTLGL